MLREDGGSGGVCIRVFCVDGVLVGRVNFTACCEVGFIFWDWVLFSFAWITGINDLSIICLSLWAVALLSVLYWSDCCKS